MPELKVVWIVGMAYSGSSLLNALLNSQPGIRGVGEGAWVYRKGHVGGPCTYCQTPTADCCLYGTFDGTDFYTNSAAHYENTNVIVDSSKHARWLVEHAAEEPNCDYFAILLSKTPHEQAFSLLGHYKWDHWNPDKRHHSVSACFRSYDKAYRKYISVLSAYFGRQYAKRVRTIHYREMAADPVATISRICDWIGSDFDRHPILAGWNDTDTHILGGNPAIISQLTGNDSLSFAVARNEYLQGKYSDRSESIFVDRCWESDPLFCKRCRKSYELEHVSNDVLCTLGHRSVESLMDDTCQVV